MENTELIKIFLNNGFQVEPRAINLIKTNTGRIDTLLQYIKNLKNPPYIITHTLVENLLKQLSFEIRKIKTFDVVKRTYRTEDFIKTYSSRYDNIKKMLTKRIELVNLISINKISQKTKKFSIIAMVKEKIDNTLVIEDPTGILTVNFIKKANGLDSITLDETIGLVCEKTNDEILVNEVVFPDIPFKKDVMKTKDNIYCLFISDLHLDKAESKDSYQKFCRWVGGIDFKPLFIFVLGDVSTNKNDVIDFFASLPKECKKMFLSGETDPNTDMSDVLYLNDPSFIAIQETKLFLTHGQLFAAYQNLWRITPEKVYLNLIKKRHLNPTFEFSKKLYENDSFYLDIIPDIFVAGHFQTPGITNYKGTTILSTGSFVTEPTYWLINLKTRETIKVSFT